MSFPPRPSPRTRSAQEEEASPRPVGLPQVNSSPWLLPVCGSCGRAGRTGETERACDRTQVGCDQSPGCSDTQVCPREQPLGCQGLSLNSQWRELKGKWKKLEDRNGDKSPRKEAGYRGSLSCEWRGCGVRTEDPSRPVRMGSSLGERRSVRLTSKWPRLPQGLILLPD